MGKLVVGETLTNKDGHRVTIKSLNKNRVILVTEKGNCFETDRSAVRQCIFKVRDAPTVCGVGYIGYGIYKSKQNGKHTPSYQSWRDMLRRCYDKGSVRWTNYGDEGVSVCSEWHNFQNFAGWYCTQHVGQFPTYHLEKDFSGMKEYSPKNCKLLPSYLNASIVDTSKRETKGFTLSGTKEHRVYISCLGEQYQLPNHSKNGSLQYYNFFKKNLLILVADLSLLCRHIDITSYNHIVAYCGNLQTVGTTSKMVTDFEKLRNKILKDNKTCVKLGIDNGVEIINLYWEDQLKRVEDWVNK